MLALCVTALLATTVFIASAGAESGSAKLTKVSVRLDWFAGGYHAGFYAAKAKGYYKSAGLDVSIEEGQGSSSTVQLVGSGKDTFGFVSPVAMIQAVAAGAPVKMVGAIYQSDGAGILVRSDSGITNAKQLEGKSCGTSPYGYIHRLMPAYFAKIGGDWSKVNATSVDPSALIPSLAKGQLDAICDAVAVDEPMQLRHKGVPGRFFLLSKAGVSPLGWGLVASQSTIASNPKLVKAFVAATLKGFTWAFANPKKAIAAFHAQVKAAYPVSVDVQSLVAGRALIHTAATKKKPLGWMAKSDWVGTVNLMTQYLDLKADSAPGVGTLYTNSFVPSSKG